MDVPERRRAGEIGVSLSALHDLCAYGGAILPGILGAVFAAAVPTTP
jgi:hypothetical protein